jgi:hypothetical protein
MTTKARLTDKELIALVVGVAGVTGLLVTLGAVLWWLSLR